MRKILTDASFLTIRLDKRDLEKLDQAVKASGRGNRSDVLRRLITLVDTQAGHAVLGIVDPEPANEWRKEIG